MSSNSNTEEVAKRQRVESPDVSLLDTPKTPVDVFEESLKSEDCVKNLLKCMRNLEKEVKISTSWQFPTTATKLKAKSS